MTSNEKSNKFRQLVENKYQIYNSLFMSLPYDKMTNIGMLLPFLYEESREGYEQGKSPLVIMDEFFKKHTKLSNEEEKIELLFKIVQYIERQVVLFDSIEDAAFPKLHSKSDPGTITNLYERGQQEGKLDKIREKMEDFGIRVVFTAHPTQFYPNSVQRILHDLNKAIEVDAIEDIDLLLQQLGKTPFVNKEKPSPVDEAMSIMYYLRYVYYETVGLLYKKIKHQFKAPGFIPSYNLFQLGFWPGGDRDGNPFVTSEVTRQVATELRINILKCYYGHLKNIRRRLSFRGVSDILEKLSGRIYQGIFDHNKLISKELILEKSRQALEILDKEHQGLFRELLEDFIDRVEIFGTHFATLDLRQDSRVHQAVIDDIIEKKSPLDKNASIGEKLDWLLKADLDLDPNDFEGITKDTLETIRLVKTIQEENGEKGIQRYIISNSDHKKDVLNVYALFRLSGYSSEEINLQIVPLFETIEGLDKAPGVMKQLYELPMYKKHLERLNNYQTVMLGFSDGTKDGGYLKANWEIYQTKENLTRVSTQYGYKVIFFDGRGGPPARGGGKTHDFYASQGPTIANHKIEITIQGQTITSVFGNKDQAGYNFEQLLTAGIENEVFESEKNAITQSERELLIELATRSLEKYLALKSHPMFVPYLEEMSTLPYYGRANIGSRPSKRGSGDELKFEDLRAIPFVGSWSQLKQNVPGFFGFGTAIQELKNEGRLEEVKALYRNSDFFKTLVLNSMMSLNKSYFPLTSYMKEDPKFGNFWKILESEYLLSTEAMLEVTGFERLQEEEPLSRKSVKLRERIVLPLLTIQQYALMKIKDHTSDTESYEKLVTRSLFGNINASRNSA